VKRPPRPTRAVRSARMPPFLIVSGMSGSGKSHAIRALEDLGYFCVDNLPVALMPLFVDLVLSGRREVKRAAVVVDVRGGKELARFPAILRTLKQRHGTQIRMLFLEATDAAILRRFSETRRPHPLAGSQSVAEGVAKERRRLQTIRRLSDEVVDTSSLTVHDLRRRILESIGGHRRVAPLIVNVVSFGFRRGAPVDADLMFDVRFMPNPNFVPSLRRWTGRPPAVARYVMRAPAAKSFLALTTALLRFLVPQYISEGKTYLTIAIGCTGGRHRSVAVAEALAKRLRHLDGIQLRVRHRDAAEA